MSTGDMLNNLRCLQSCLKAININPLTDKNKKDLKKGAPKIFIYILRFSLLEFSHPIAQLIASQQIQLSVTNDVRFIDGVYKVLRDIFNYKPTISKDMFLSTGFAERKIIMMQDVIRMAQKKNQELTRKKKTKGKKPTGVSMPKAPSLPGAYGVVSPIMSDHDGYEASLSQSGALTAVPMPKFEHQEDSTESMSVLPTPDDEGNLSALTTDAKPRQPHVMDGRPPLPTGINDVKPPPIPVCGSHLYGAPSPGGDPVMIIELSEQRNHGGLVTRHVPYPSNPQTPCMSHDQGYKSAEVSPTSELVEITHFKDNVNACMKVIGKLDSRLNDVINRVESLEQRLEKYQGAVANRDDERKNAAMQEKLGSMEKELKTVMDRLVLMENQVVILNTLGNYPGQMTPSTIGSSVGRSGYCTLESISQGKQAQTGSEISHDQRHTCILSPSSLTSGSPATSAFSSPEPEIGSPFSDSSPLSCKATIKVHSNAGKMDKALQTQIDRVSDIMKVTESMLQSKLPSYTQGD
ncbi:uncharacterized protein LOC117112810 [Anneissia japonica]|uniref:uncharacterized protein LOC117112810 n=1 Tax=Anneissia japonica TaxID=1529436 RepID=UPI001425A00E|nr:uncharacterized protein LOC117112810 [Anneissia japonica]XP_033111877.1 uncharacterized protein LOC117112810 [Anneissia japonica]XP_033111878.1 uncharacterized protein LOC117112810 [Anneissia japonica]XP_033111879.1 uncharacterized protein LOC117112810 [Anneissia japonica]